MGHFSDKGHIGGGSTVCVCGRRMPLDGCACMRWFQDICSKRICTVNGSELPPVMICFLLHTLSAFTSVFMTNNSGFF